MSVLFFLALSNTDKCTIEDALDLRVKFDFIAKMINAGLLGKVINYKTSHTTTRIYLGTSFPHDLETKTRADEILQAAFAHFSFVQFFNACM
jgi:hypothetical protein